MKMKKARLGDNYWQVQLNKKRRIGTAIKTIERIRFEEYQLGKLGAASKPKKIEITEEDNQRYLEMLK